MSRQTHSRLAPSTGAGVRLTARLAICHDHRSAQSGAASRLCT